MAFWCISRSLVSCCNYYNNQEILVFPYLPPSKLKVFFPSTTMTELVWGVFCFGVLGGDFCCWRWWFWFFTLIDIFYVPCSWLCLNAV